MQYLLMIELLFVTVILFVRISHSLKCYQCRSDVNAGCSSTMFPNMSKDCPQKGDKAATVCRKIHQQLKFKDEKSWTSIRECGYEKQGSSCYKNKWLELGYQEVCECAKENCNSGRSQVPETLTLALTTFTWIYNYLRTNIT